MNPFLVALLNMLKANPQMLISILEMLVGYLKANPDVAAKLIEQVAAQAAPKK